MELRYNLIGEIDNIDIDSVGYSIPFHEVKRLIEALKYASGYRVAIELLALTGMRVSELDNLKTNCFYGETIVWKVGKGQKGYRKENLPKWFLIELDDYIKNHNFINGCLFGFGSNHLTTYINKKIRPILKGDWLKKRLKMRGSCKGLEYIFQMKSLRHNWATLEFRRNMDKYGLEASVHLTSRKMKHSSTHMTASHYLEDFDKLNIERYKDNCISDLIKSGNQRKVTEFF